MSPIVGLTDQPARFPHLGELRKGAPKPERGIGPDLKTHFRFTSTDPLVVADFRQLYGDKPEEIEFRLAWPSIAENLEEWKEAWTAGALQHRCNGVTCVLWLDDKGHYQTTPKACPGGCKAVGRLRIVIPKLGRLGTVSVLTTSKHDIIALWTNLLAFHSLRQNLTGMPFRLSRRPRKISTPDKNGRRVRMEKWLLYLEIDPTWVQRQLAAWEREALPLLADAEVSVPGDVPRLTGATQPQAPDVIAVGGRQVERATGEIVGPAPAADFGGAPDPDDEDDEADFFPSAVAVEPPSPTPAPPATSPTAPPVGPPRPDPQSIQVKSLGDLFNAALRLYNWPRPRVLKELGVKSERLIGDAQAAWETIINANQEPESQR